MSQAHETNPNKPNEDQLGFVVPFDGTQAEVEATEREAVSARFNDLVADTYLNYADQVQHYEHSHEDSLLLKKSDDEHEDVRWTLAIRSDTDPKPPSDEWESAEEIRKQINIQKIKNGKGREYHSYRMGSDGIVRRYDIGDVYMKIGKERAVGVGSLATSASIEHMSPEDRTRSIEQRIDERMTVSIPNSRLERKMGLNNQPIGLEELEGLKKFVEQPGFEVPETLRRRAQPA